MPEFAARLETIQLEMAKAADAVGRNLDEVTLVAVSKNFPPEALQEALEAGQSLFGESRVQEARAKQEEVSGRARWHFIGHLQKNKIRAALGHFELLHSVDSLELARQIQRIAAEEGVRQEVLLEVNVAGEGSKFGFAPEAVPAVMEELLTLDRLSIQGLMTIPPIVREAEDARQYFAELRECRDALEEEFDLRLPELSMGMSGDFTAAIKEGATLIRVGTALFGKRPPRELSLD